MTIIIKPGPHLTEVHSLTLGTFPPYGVGYTNIKTPRGPKGEQPTSVEKDLAKDWSAKKVKNELLPS